MAGKTALATTQKRQERVFHHAQLMVGSACGLHGQLVVGRVGLVASQGAEPVLTPPLLTEGKTALGTTVR